MTFMLHPSYPAELARILARLCADTGSDSVLFFWARCSQRASAGAARRLELQGERFYYITAGFAINQVWVSADRAQNQDPDQGMLAFYVYNRVSYEQEADGVFATPARDGPITIQSVIFPRVYVQTKRGTLLTFNLETLQWEDAHPP